MEKIKIYNEFINYYGYATRCIVNGRRYQVWESFIKEGGTLTLRTDNAGSIVAFEYEILKVVEFDTRENAIILEVELIEDHDIPSEWYNVNEYSSKHFFSTVAWFKTEKEALERFKDVKYGEITKSSIWNPASYVLHTKKWED